MQILFVTPEVAPFSKTSGLADVAAGLPAELARRGHEVVVVSPFYRCVAQSGLKLSRRRLKLNLRLGSGPSQGGVFEHSAATGPSFLFIEKASYFDRPGIYGEGDGHYPDNNERFAFFCRATLELCRAAGLTPQVIHLNDWPCGPVAPLLQAVYRERPELNATGTIFTVHNPNRLGLFPPATLMLLGLGWEHFTPSGLEYHGKVSFLKAGLVYSDRLSAVSARLARELLEPPGGFGLESLWRERRADLRGIINGIDADTWNPATCPHLAANYQAGDLAGKALCKQDLQRQAGLPENAALPLVGAISRLTERKGWRQFLEVSAELLELPVQWVILGSGESRLERDLDDLAARYRGKLAHLTGMEEQLAHRLLAGSDMLLVPSLHEPCGLVQLYAMRYGTVPVARAVGGLADTVDDAGDEDGNGFLFSGDGEQLVACMRRAIEQWNDRPAWLRLVQTAMNRDLSWQRPARQYELLYQQVATLRAGSAG